MRKYLFALTVTLGLLVSNAFADCPQFYPLGEKIEVPNSVELCNSFYAVEYDTKLNAPIISVERLQPEAGSAERTNDFHPDLRLTKGSRAEKSDYLHSGYDQGHLTPAADAATAIEMHDTFLLSNMTPQEPTLNRLAWKQLEINVRKLMPDYVVTGAYYSANPKGMGKHAVPIPSGYYKITWELSTGNSCTIRVWAADNTPHAEVVALKIEDVEELSGIHFPRCSK